MEERRTSHHISSCSYRKSCSSMSVGVVPSSIAAIWAWAWVGGGWWYGQLLASAKASDAPGIVPAYGGFCVAVVHSVRLIIITAVFIGAGLLRVRWSIIWSWWLFWFRLSFYSTRLLRSTRIMCSVMWGRAVHFYTSIIINMLIYTCTCSCSIITTQ